MTAKLTDDAKAQRNSLEKATKENHRQLENLTKLRLRNMVTDEEFVHQRQELDRERLKLVQRVQESGESDSWLEPAKVLISFSSRAPYCFREGNAQTKRFILEIVGLNPTLLDGKLNIEARKPFRRWSGTPEISNLWAGVEDVRTLWLTDNEAVRDMIAKIRQVNEMVRATETKLAA